MPSLSRRFSIFSHPITSHWRDAFQILDEGENVKGVTFGRIPTPKALTQRTLESSLMGSSFDIFLFRQSIDDCPAKAIGNSGVADGHYFPLGKRSLLHIALSAAAGNLSFLTNRGFVILRPCFCIARVSQSTDVAYRRELVPVEEQYTERAFIEPGREPYEAERRESKLVQAFCQYLGAKGHAVQRLLGLW